MNCLLLLLILFGCGQGNGIGGCTNNRRCGNGTRNHSCCNQNQSTIRSTEECGCIEEIKKKEDCGCSGSMNRDNHDNRQMFTPPPTARTQYPYLESEPRTCGCEENK